MSDEKLHVLKSGRWIRASIIIFQMIGIHILTSFFANKKAYMSLICDCK